MKIFTLIFLSCSAICWAQEEPLFPDEPLPPAVVDGGLMLPPDLPDLPDPDMPLVRCRRQMCDMECAYGLALGDDGCPICECRTPGDLCDELGECPEGMRCEVPTCFGPMCATVKAECIPECPMLKCEPCPGDKYIKDERGCQTCQCETICPMPMCAKPCEFGYATDERGCMTCNCNSQPPEGAAIEESEGGSETSDVSTENDCPRFMCRMFCEYGFEKDERGCQVCRCRSQPEHCSDVMCLMFCDYGFEKDEDGCDTCRCREQPEACPKRMCHTLISCRNGFQKDMNGCDTCTCKPDVDICENYKCNPGMTCKSILPPDCTARDCQPVPVCQPPAVCEAHQGHPLSDEEDDLLMPHLKADEEQLLYRGPVKCRPDGKFEPKQCFDGQCFCIDDRRVIQPDSLDVDNPLCQMNLTKELRLSFELKHDLDDNDLDGATKDIEALVKEMLGSWMSVHKDSVVFVEVAYIKPGVLLVFSTVLSGGLIDLFSASHHFHKQMYAGNCDMEYKHHVLHPDANTISFEHHYEQSDDPASFFVAESCFNSLHSIGAITACIFVLVVLIILTVVLIVKRRKRAASYQFRHKRMEKMDNFKKNLVLSSELDKPNLLSKDSVEVTLTENEKAVN